MGGRPMQVAETSTALITAEELDNLREQLRVADETIEAIRSGSVDSLVVGPPGKERVYSLTGVDQVYRLIVESLNEGAAVISGAGLILHANPRMTEMLGRPPSGLVGVAAVTLAEVSDRESLRRLLDTGPQDTRHAELALGMVNGDAVPVLCSVGAFNLDGEMLRCLVATDLTPLRQAAQAVEKAKAAEVMSEARYHDVVLALGEGVLVYSAVGCISEANLAAQRILGLTVEHMDMAVASWSVVDESGSPMPGEADPATIAWLTGEPQRDRTMMVRLSSGDHLWLRVNAVPVTDPQTGSVTSVVLSFMNITDMKRGERQLLHAASYARSLLEASLDPLVTISRAGTIPDANMAAEKATGLLRADLVGNDFAGYFTEPERARAAYERAFAASSVTDYPLSIRHVDGTLTDVLYNASVYTDEDGGVAGVLATARDVTELNRTQAALASEDQLRLAMDYSAIGMAVLATDGTFVRLNTTLGTILGRETDDLRTLTWRDVIHPDDVDSTAALLGDLFDRRQSSIHTLTRFLTVDGTVVWCDLSVASVPDEEGGVRHLIAQMVDVTDRVNAEHDLRQLATLDPLTGLANRVELAGELARALATDARTGRQTAVLMIDLDRFKNINDSLGHAAGDAVLMVAADRIHGSIREGDLLARTGGDEFVVVMRDLVDTGVAVEVSERIVSNLREPLRTAVGELYATASVGITISTGPTDADALVREADTAMYLAKEAGRDRAMIFSESQRSAAMTRFTTESLLRKALEQDELEVWFQPEVDLATGSMVAVEALLRWHHPSGELYTADRFIDIAEETGLILDIGDWALHSACALGATWNSLDVDPALTLRINLSTLQIAESGLLDAIDSALSASGIDPRRLCAEITETTLMRETRVTRANLEGISARGISIAIDDFGTGFASLAYLRDYPVDVLKIDRTFVTGLTKRERDRQLVAGIVGLSVGLGISVTAEGVETEEQAEQLRRLGCPTAQGFLYSKAVPADQIPDILHRIGQADRSA